MTLFPPMPPSPSNNTIFLKHPFTTIEQRFATMPPRGWTPLQRYNRRTRA